MPLPQFGGQSETLFRPSWQAAQVGRSSIMLHGALSCLLMSPSVVLVRLALWLTLVTMYTFRGLTKTRFLLYLSSFMGVLKVLQVWWNYVLL